MGHRMPRWIMEATQEYLQRMPREYPVELIEIKPDSRMTGRTTEQILEAESQRILTHVGEMPAYALDERGQCWTTMDLATTLQNTQRDASGLCFIIGSADGLHQRIKTQARGLVALSRMTLPHGMVRVILSEQLYRASMVLKGHPYHRE